MSTSMNRISGMGQSTTINSVVCEDANVGTRLQGAPRSVNTFQWQSQKNEQHMDHQVWIPLINGTEKASVVPSSTVLNTKRPPLYQQRHKKNSRYLAAMSSDLTDIHMLL